MRILHLAKYYWPRTGGRERVVRDLAEGAAELGHTVSIVAVETLMGRKGYRGHRTAIRRQLSFGTLGDQELAPGYLAAAWRGADIVHLHHPHPLADLATVLRPRRTRLIVRRLEDASIERTRAELPQVSLAHEHQRYALTALV